MQHFDHYSTIEGVRRTPSPTPSPKLPCKPLRLPRRNMQDFAYPPTFDLGENQRVRSLNSALHELYRQIGARADDLASEQERHGGLSSYDPGINPFGVRYAQIKLDEFIDEAEALLAEVAAIGGQFHIPPQLQDIVQLKSYVPAGSLDRLAGQDYFLQVDDDVVLNEHQRSVLQPLIFKGNRLDFLQVFGDRFINTVQYKGLTRSLREGFQQLALSHFPADTIPGVLNRLAQLIGCRLEDFLGDGHGDPAADGDGPADPAADGDGPADPAADGDGLGDPAADGDGPAADCDGHGDGPAADGDGHGDGPAAEGDDVGLWEEDAGEEDDFGWEEEDVGWEEDDDVGWDGDVDWEGDGWEDDDLGWGDEDAVWDDEDGQDDLGWWEEDVGGGVPAQNQHLIFISSDEDDEEQGQHIMHHIIFLSSSEDEVDQHQAQVEADDEAVLLLVVHDEERGPRHTIFLSSDEE